MNVTRALPPGDTEIGNDGELDTRVNGNAIETLLMLCVRKRALLWSSNVYVKCSPGRKVTGQALQSDWGEGPK